MPKHKPFVNKLIQQLKEKYTDITFSNITSKITKENAKDLFDSTINRKDLIILLGKNDNTSWLFDQLDLDNAKKIIMACNGKISALPQDINISLHLRKCIERNFSETALGKQCQICQETINNACRACVRCDEYFCVTCQIKLMLTGFKNGSGMMTCPFCKYDHVIIQGDIDDIKLRNMFQKGLDQRIKKEFLLKTITESQCEELFDFLDECYYSDEFDSDGDGISDDD